VTPLLAKPIVLAKKKDIESKRRKMRDIEWEGVDQKLFGILRAKRTELAQQKGVPPYIIFSDKTLKDIALRKPTTLDQFSEVFGVGDAKQKEYGEIFIELVKNYPSQERLPTTNH
jgi:ATP-dependent DNA helicase RecQ